MATTATQGVGELAHAGKLNPFVHKGAHAATGFATGMALNRGDLRAGATGAAGAVIGEMLGELQAESLEKDLESGTLSPAGFDRRRLQAVSISKLGAATAAFVTGQDVSLAAQTSETAAEHNSFLIKPAIEIAKSLGKQALKSTAKKGAKKAAKKAGKASIKPVKTYGDFRKRFQGRFKSSEDTSQAWKSYKQRHGIKTQPQKRMESARRNPRPHGNTKTNKSDATLYRMVEEESGKHLKWGISKNPAARYGKNEMIGKKLLEKRTGPRDQMLNLERKLVERKPGPLNKEPWAGARKPGLGFKTQPGKGNK